MVYGRVPGPSPTVALSSDHTAGGFIFSFLRAIGSTRLNTNAAGSAVTYSYTVPSTRSAHISRCNMVLLDADQYPGRFGGVTSLTTGCKFITLEADGSQAFDFLDGETIKMNADFTLLAGTDNNVDAGPTNAGRYVRWTIAKAGQALRLRGGEGIGVVVQDDLSGLVDFKILVQGVLL